MKEPAMIRKSALALCATLALSGCASWSDSNSRTQRGTVVEYLYPKGERPTLAPAIPELRLPLRVGIAFVPGERFGDLSEAERNLLLNKVKAAFANRPYISAIEVIPGAYLRAGGGFDNLQQAARMFNVDVVTLLSYDQVQFNDSNRLSLLYWTIVGAYLVNGDQYDVNTLVDASVFDVSSRTLLFRAPGTSQIKGSSPLVKFSEVSREARSEGFRKAIDSLIPQLDQQLESFKIRVKEEKVARVVEKPGYSGGDSGLAGLGLIGLAAALAVARKRRGG
jgi:rhombotail lipoprotein